MERAAGVTGKESGAIGMWSGDPPRVKALLIPTLAGTAAHLLVLPHE